MEFAFVAGNLALDFVATIASRDTVAEEKLSTPTDLAEWLVLSGAVSKSSEISAEEFERAIGFRETIYAALRDRIATDTVDAGALAAINSAAAGPTPVPVLSGGRVATYGTATAAIALVARAAQLALTDPRLRFCAGAGCTRPFIDASRGGTRRWCGMSGCGDRAKAAAYRRRSSAKR
ncbi:CGNR zinc finger domain-containing protein [Microbacterium sp. NPDC028030]|uniref:CGNR zinc finger domain-containing protein n=1 Tax=Microbacterium sp. NPDC028030 TaxID=3155124 RepID=UPI0033C71953